MDIKIVGIRFDEERLSYFTFSGEVAVGDLAIVNLDGFPFAGTVEKLRLPREDENLKIYDSIIRVATAEDIENYRDNLRSDIKLISVIQKEADALDLDMTVFRVTSSLDCTKIKVMYTSEDRVDFRNLLKILASKLHARLELRQVGPRDRAKMIGGIGICGRPLCCSSFLNTFDVISISMAKNQMLSINIPKLSGQCGKLICCLKYENETYSQEKEGFPKLGSIVKYGEKDMKIINMNVLSKTLTLSDRESRVTISLEEFNKEQNKKKKPVKDFEKFKFKEHNKANSNHNNNKNNNNSNHSSNKNINNSNNNNNSNRHKRDHRKKNPRNNPHEKRRYDKKK